MQPTEMTARLGELEAFVEAACADLVATRGVERMWERDHTLWQSDPAEVSNRLGWLDSPTYGADILARLTDFASSVRAGGFTHAVVLGMGGSSLAPDVFARTFGGETPRGLHLSVLDSTDPAAVLAAADRSDPAQTLYLVSTKSGNTVETLSFFKYFFNAVLQKVGSERAGSHFVAITDPGSQLVEIASTHGFRETFLNDPNIGGRYSALSYFGLVPAALAGADLTLLMARAAAMAERCRNPYVAPDGNPGAWLGAAMGTLALMGRDKLTLVTSPSIAAFGAWAEQLVAESTGKLGRGILPVDQEPLGSPEVYRPDRFFVYIRLTGDLTHDDALDRLARAGHPVIRIDLVDRYDLGGEFVRWEVATALAGWRLGINPFDQPNVESAKRLAQSMVTAYAADGALPVPSPAVVDGARTAYGEAFNGLPNLQAALDRLLEMAQPGAYFAIQAYLPSGPELDAALARLRLHLRDQACLATTVGYGPRYLHSTGQLHKGDQGRGLFLVLTADDAEDVPIPDAAGGSASTMTFGVLKQAQALGDRQALLDGGRAVLWLGLGGDAVGGVLALLP